MSYRSSLSQRKLDGVYFSNSSATNQSITETNTSYIANLQYVQNWISQSYSGFMEILNPIFTGTLSGPNITLTGTLEVPTITSNTNFTTVPTITVGSTIYNVSTVPAGTVKMLISNLNPPPNYLLCDGSSYAVGDYPNLYAVIGNTYGGNTTNFNVPNMESYFPIGGNSVNTLGCSESNYATGNGTTGASNTFSTSSNFGGSSTAIAPLITTVPNHSHNITDPGHSHNTQLALTPQSYIIFPLGPDAVYPGSPGLSTTSSSANVIIGNTGTGIQNTDPISGLSGVNVSPPYVAVFFYIAIG